jgi:hypothetical protein
VVAGTGYGGAAASGFELDPMYQQLAQFGGGVNIPSLTAKGALDPYDIGQEAQRVNLAQDQASSLADLIQAALAGPGAIDPSSFAPVRTMPTERIATPGLTRLNAMAEGSGYKGYIAQKIKGGATDDEAVADLFNFLDAPEDESIDPKLRETKQSIIDSLPSAFKSGNQLTLPSQGVNTRTGTSAAAGRPAQDTRDLFQESEIGRVAEDLYMKAYDDRAKVDVGWEDPDHPGTYYTQAPTEEDSAATTKFKNLGLPTPFAAYDDPKYLQMAYDTLAPGVNQEGANWDEQVAKTQRESDKVAKESQGPIDRNIATQKRYRDTGGYRWEMPPAPPPMGRGDVTEDPTTGGTVDANGHGVFSLRSHGAMSPVDANGHGVMSDYSPSPQPVPPRFDMNTQPSPTKVPIRGIANPDGGFDFGSATARPAESQAMANRILNFVGGMPLGGGSDRGTKTVTLNADTARQSASAADAARRKFAAANIARYQATQALGNDQGNAITAWENARYNAMPVAQGGRGRTPFVDAIMQRKLGQRALGLRA